MSRNFSWKKILLVSLLAIAFLPQISGLQALAQVGNTPDINWGGVAGGANIGKNDGECSAWPTTWPTCILVGISYFPGLLVALAAFMITLGLEMNSHLVDTSIVKSGFDITLAVANLGFVFAIILIALATIIGYESYGMKKNLWKLVASALLVNFSLVICSVIIGFFDQFAYFFAARMGDYNTYGYSGLANQLVNAFSLNKISAWTLKDQGAFLPTIIFIIIFLLIIAFTLFAIALMLIVRYIYLAILMILMPIAWLAWVVPGMQKHWDSWWQNFIKWTLSPTIILTLLYIAIIISTNSNNQIIQWTTDSLKGGSAGTVVNNATLSSDGESFISVIVRMVVSLALVWGAIIAANAMGAKGASTAMNWNKAIGKRAKNYTLKTAKRATNATTSYIPRTESGRAATSWLQQAGNNARLFGYSVAPAFKPIRKLGTSVAQSREAGEKLLADSQKEIKSLSYVEQARRFGSVKASSDRLAIMMSIQKGLSSKKEDEKRAAEQAFALLPKTTRKDMAMYEESTNLEKAGLLDSKDKYRETRFGRLKLLYGKVEEKPSGDSSEELIKKIKEEAQAEKEGQASAAKVQATVEVKTEKSSAPTEPPKKAQH